MKLDMETEKLQKSVSQAFSGCEASAVGTSAHGVEALEMRHACVLPA